MLTLEDSMVFTLLQQFIKKGHFVVFVGNKIKEQRVGDLQTKKNTVTSCQLTHYSFYGVTN